MKVLYLFLEKIGLDPMKHGIVTLATIAEIDGEVHSKNEFQMAPFPADEFDPYILKRNGLTEEEVQAYPDPITVFRGEILPLLDNHIDLEDGNDKFIIAGNHVIFDVYFLERLFLRCEEFTFGNYFDGQTVDLYSILHFFKFRRDFGMLNYNLPTVAEYFEVPLESPTPMNNVTAIRGILRKIREGMKWEELVVE